MQENRSFVSYFGTFPGADGLAAFWDLLRSGRDATRDVPAERWDNANFFDSEPQAPGKSYVRRGGYLDDVASFDAEFFVDSALAHGAEACNYLLTVDMEMNPIPGYQLSSWALGYGDFHLRPDLATLRVAA